MKRGLWRNSLAAIVCAIAILGLSFEAAADYFPSNEFLNSMTDLAVKNPTNVNKLPGNVLLKSIRVGTIYQAGQVAYFFVTVDQKFGEIIDIGMQLEDWKDTKEGNLRLTTSRFYPDRMIRWSLTLTVDGTLVNESIAPEETFPTNSPEAIKASERTQELLKEAYKI